MTAIQQTNTTAIVLALVAKDIVTLSELLKDYRPIEATEDEKRMKKEKIRVIIQLLFGEEEKEEEEEEF
jgi:hypothetical protein